MGLSFPTKDDQQFVEMLANFKALGADVSVITNESDHTVRRIATIAWETHNPAARVITKAVQS